jgi:diacylglycerol kinase
VSTLTVSHGHEPSDRKRGASGDLRNMRDAFEASLKHILPGRSMRIFLGIAGSAIVLLFVRNTSLERLFWVWSFVVITLVAEAMNTVIEAVCDLMWPRLKGESNSAARTRQPRVATIKHLAAGVVFVSGLFGTVPVFIFVMLYPR